MMIGYASLEVSMAEQGIPLPVRYQGAITKLIDLSEKNVEQLQGALAEERPTLSPSDLEDRLAIVVQEVEAEDIRQIIDMLLSFYTGRAILNLSASQFAENIMIPKAWQIDA